MSLLPNSDTDRRMTGDGESKAQIQYPNPALTLTRLSLRSPCVRVVRNRLTSQGVDRNHRAGYAHVSWQRKHGKNGKYYEERKNINQPQ